MNDLNRALGDIRSIRRQMALTTEFRGYGPLTLAATGVVALLAAWAQARWVPQPVAHPVRYVAVWAATAVVSAALIAVQTLTRTRRVHSGMETEMIRMAATQFAPAALAGSLLTFVMIRASHDGESLVWLLPGLWQLVYSLGIFASCRFLPRAISAAGVWFMVTGLLCIALGNNRALAPWLMAFPFAVGQGLIALVLQMAAREASDEN